MQARDKGVTDNTTSITTSDRSSVNVFRANRNPLAAQQIDRRSIPDVAKQANAQLKPRVRGTHRYTCDIAQCKYYQE
jgi:hypothetical protein